MDALPRVGVIGFVDDGYIARRSGHSRGSTVDVTIVRRPPAPQERYEPGDALRSCIAPRTHRFADNSLDMGTGYDCFENYANEWWHHTLRDEPHPRRTFDFPAG